MHNTGFALVMLAAAACGGKGDDCQKFWDKSAPMMAKAAGGKAMPADAKDSFLKQCREGDRMKKDPVFRCVLDASGDDAVNACMSKAFGDYASKGKATEAKIQLNRLGKDLKALFIETGAYPIGKAATLPADPCCKGAGGTCDPVPAATWDADPIWKQIGFMVDVSTRFQYSYESSDGKTATATAVGDLDCDGTAMTYRLDVTVVEGNPMVELVEPTTQD